MASGDLEADIYNNNRMPCVLENLANPYLERPYPYEFDMPKDAYDPNRFDYYGTWNIQGKFRTDCQYENRHAFDIMGRKA